MSQTFLLIIGLLQFLTCLGLVSAQFGELLVQLAKFGDEQISLLQSLFDAGQLCLEVISLSTLVVAGANGPAGGSPVGLELLLDEVEQPVVVPPGVSGPAAGVQGGA